MRTVILGFVLLLVYSCRTPHFNEINRTFNGDTLKLSYAKGFSIIKYKNVTEVKIFNPYQNAQNIELKYLLQNSNSTIKAEKANHYIRVPVRKVICLSTTHLAYISVLNELNTITGISGNHLIFNPILREKVSKGEIFEVGYENNLDYEKIITAKPDVVFAYGVGSESNGYILKFKELGIPVVMVSEYLEEHPLARTEWIKFFATFYGKEQQAQHYFDSITQNYNRLRLKASYYKVRPKIMMALPWNGSWFISGQKTYMANIINDAGGEYIWNNLETNISIPMSMEQVFKKSRNADIWINIGQATDKSTITKVDKRLMLLKAYQTGKLYNNNERITKTGGNDYWESGVIHPDIILRELIHIFHAEYVLSDSLYYYKKLE